MFTVSDLGWCLLVTNQSCPLPQILFMIKFLLFNWYYFFLKLFCFRRMPPNEEHHRKWKSGKRQNNQNLDIRLLKWLTVHITPAFLPHFINSGWPRYDIPIYYLFVGQLLILTCQSNPGHRATFNFYRDATVLAAYNVPCLLYMNSAFYHINILLLTSSTPC